MRHNKEEIQYLGLLITRHFYPFLALVISIICPTLVIFVRGARTHTVIGDELLRRDLDNNCCVAADGCCYTGRWRAKTVLVACAIATENTWASCQRQVRDTKVVDDVFTVTRSPRSHWGTLTFMQDGRR